MNDEQFLLLARSQGQNEGKSFLYLASLYYKGTEITPKNIDKALYYYEKAAEAGEVDGAYNAAVVHDEMGHYISALSWYKKAAELGEDKAMYNLGLMYAEGQGVTQDYKQAIAWYIKAGKLGNIKAIYNLGVMEHEGLGLPRNYEGALEKYQLSGSAGHDVGAYNAGVLYEQVFKDYVNAFLWYEKAANLGLAEGMFEIGKMYHQGIGVAVDNSKAEYWLIRAYESGSSSAKQYLIKHSSPN